ncbi:Polyketide cyclase / dehydrase and lipid transport [Nocardioides exalbidus]|uniref:Polyketide cyclase / dehydrase and lipid transport n=1 Tax=Nocardioides exalbidus TaxID=402596 RepID=A0A1H4Y1F9_9ACTN|nr:SRPBCC family protein [Nocardioides exalbidus]SED10824.1 Polyketide cyclase / dehydrase and lipid transport [Nocardioides exalbidus]
MLVHAHGPAGADEAWLRFTTPSTWPVWAPLITAVEASHDELEVGTTGRVHGPGPVSIDFEVTAVDAVRRSWSWRVHRGPASVEMSHHVLPAAGGGSRALLRVHGASATLLQPYRIPAAAALRGLVRDRFGLARDQEPVETFDFRFDRTYALAGRPFGITPRTTTIEVGPEWLYVGYGPWRLATPRSNIASAEASGGFGFVKTAGPPHLSLADRGISFTTNGERALCLTFHSPVPAIDPTGTIRHPGATLSVADPARLAEALGLSLPAA